jgi:hypothetical protein
MDQSRQPSDRDAERRDFYTAYHQVNGELNRTRAGSGRLATHLTTLAFFAALVRAGGVALKSADDIYVAGYYAKRQQQGRELYPYERTQLRSAADRIWAALQQVTEVSTSAHSRAVTQGEGSLNG